MKELIVFAPNRPGQLASITGALAAAGVNVEAFDVEAFGEEGLASLTVDDCDGALRALRDAGFHAVTQETILVRIEDKPGALAAVAARLRDAGLDIRSMHIIRRDGSTSIASLVADDQSRAAGVLSDLVIR
jgi:hypothetical protein